MYAYIYGTAYFFTVTLNTNVMMKSNETYYLIGTNEMVHNEYIYFILLETLTISRRPVEGNNLCREKIK